MDHIISSLGVFTQGAIVCISLIGLILHVRWTRKATLLGPTLLTTLGIFFCFSGIAWGLLDFNPGDIKESVPRLLQGIRTSFWASVFGIGWALTIKLRVLWFGDPSLPTDGEPTGATVDDLAEHLSRLNRSVAGADDSTVLGQIKLLRNDNNERLDGLTSSFERFAEKMAEANSKALIEALSEVIRDFNTKLNEQFGENFKHLNAAVEKLVVWQKQYEQQLNALIQQETATRKSMTESSLRYAELVNKSTVFTATAAALQEILTATRMQSEQLNTSLRGLAELVTKAATGLPLIEVKIVEMTRQIEHGVRTNQEALGAVLRTSAQAMQTHNQELTTLLKSTIAGANKDLNGHIRQATEDTKKHIVALDKALEEELTKSIESLGRQLTALSQKFVQDYTPLTQKLQQLLQSVRT
jgi:molybdopterin converting factor small subunit